MKNDDFYKEIREIINKISMKKHKTAVPRISNYTANTARKVLYSKLDLRIQRDRSLCACNDY